MIEHPEELAGLALTIFITSWGFYKAIQIIRAKQVIVQMRLQGYEMKATVEGIGAVFYDFVGILTSGLGFVSAITMLVRSSADLLASYLCYGSIAFAIFFFIFHIALAIFYTMMK